MIRSRITFHGCKATARRQVPCAGCGKIMTRSKTFEHTISPFNTRADGTPKSREEVQRDVRAAADRWDPTGAMCRACDGGSSGE